MTYESLLPLISPEELTPLVRALLDIITKQAELITRQGEQLAKQAEQIQRGKEQIQALRDDIAVLKGEKAKPKIPKSKLESDKSESKEKDKEGKRPGSAKHSKTAELEIHETVTLTPQNIGDDWVFKGYNDFVVQGLIIEPHNTKYRQGRWQTPEGLTATASLPARVSGYFDSVLVSYIQHQYYNCRVTQPLLLGQLKEIGIDISSGQLNNILTENQDEFHCEKEGILHAGLAVSKYARVDDTGARHEGKNGFSTCIRNDLFTFFASSGSKSRINFLEILRTGQSHYVINEDALTYMQEELLKKALVASLKDASNKYFPDKDAWLKHIEN